MKKRILTYNEANQAISAAITDGAVISGSRRYGHETVPLAFGKLGNGNFVGVPYFVENDFQLAIIDFDEIEAASGGVCFKRKGEYVSTVVKMEELLWGEQQVEARAGIMEARQKEDFHLFAENCFQMFCRK
jgi:hypothetical protein